MLSVYLEVQFVGSSLWSLWTSYYRGQLKHLLVHISRSRKRKKKEQVIETKESTQTATNAQTDDQQRVKIFNLTSIHSLLPKKEKKALSDQIRLIKPLYMVTVLESTTGY